MNNLNQIQKRNFKRLFPSIPTELAYVVVLYSSGATQLEISHLLGLSKDKVNEMLHSAKVSLGLHSVQAIRVVVHNRLYFAVLGLLDF